MVADFLEYCQGCQGRAGLVEGCSHSLAGEELLQAADMGDQVSSLAVSITKRRYSQEQRSQFMADMWNPMSASMCFDSLRPDANAKLEQLSSPF